MSLVTLSGVISAADLNTNFADKKAAVAAVNASAHRDTYLHLSVANLVTADGQDRRTFDWAASDDFQVVTMGLAMWNPDATSRTVTASLTAVDASGQVVLTKYLTPIVLTVTGGAAAEFQATRTNYLTAPVPQYLVRGLTYRITVTRSDANGGSPDATDAVLQLRYARRYL